MRSAGACQHPHRLLEANRLISDGQFESETLMPDTEPSVIAQDAPLLYRLLQGIAFALLRILTELDVEGLEHVPRSGPIIVAPNHIHLLDSVLAFRVIPRRITALAADKWRIPPIGCLLSVIGHAIYVARGEADRRALAKAIALKS